VKPPSTTAGTVGAAVGLLAVGGAVGGIATSLAVKGKGDPLDGTILTVEAVIWGVMAAGFGGLVFGYWKPAWKDVGETAALVGVGAPLVLGAIGLTRATLAQAETPALLPQGPQTYQITADDTGQTFTLNIGDTVDVVLDASMPAPTASATGIVAAGASTTAAAIPAVAATTSPAAAAVAAVDSMVTYPFTATAAGTVTLTSTPTSTTPTTTGAAAPAAFTITLTVSPAS
jgi:hypothetical protein